MKLEVISEKETPLLSRKRISLMAFYDGKTPSRQELIAEVAKKIKKSKDLIIIKHIYGRFGSQKCKIIANVYDDEKSLKQIEDEYLTKKHVAPEAPKVEPKEEAKEAPKEEAKEAPKEEPKETPKETKEAPKEEPKETPKETKEAPKEEAKPKASDKS